VINGDRLRFNRGKILHYERKLDLQNEILSRTVRWRSPTGNTVDLRFEHFVSLADHQFLGLCCQITPVDFSSTIEIQSNINGYPDNQGFDAIAL
jgi:kojibiose phosphorylase